jgi:hypothetical protein
MATRRRVVVASTLVVVVVAVAIGLWLWLGAGGGGGTFSVSYLEVTSHPSLGYSEVDFTVSNRNTVPMVSLEVDVNNESTAPLTVGPTASYPIPPGQTVTGLSYSPIVRIVQGQTYTVVITAGFGDGTNASFSWTVVAGGT